MMIGMFIQTLYFIVDLYFVSKLGSTALARLSLAANLTFNQSMMLFTVLGIIVCIISYISAKFHLNLISQNPETIII